MNRLTVIFPLVITAFVGPGLAASVSGQEAYYTIAGDVAQPDTYAFPVGQSVHLLDLLHSTGTRRSDGTVVIVHDSPQQAPGQETVQRGQTHRGACLTPGDVVVFHGPDPRPETQNVVLLTDDRPLTLRFTAESVSVAKLLAGVRAALPAGTAIPVVRTEHGHSQSIQLTESDQVRHGDVLVLWSVMQLSGVRLAERFSSGSDSFAQAASTEPTPVQEVPEVLPGDSHADDRHCQAEADCAALWPRETTVVPRAPGFHEPAGQDFPDMRSNTAPESRATPVTTAAYRAEAGDLDLLFPERPHERAASQPAPAPESTARTSGSPAAAETGSAKSSSSANAEAAAVAAALGGIETATDESGGSSFLSILLIVAMPVCLGLVVAGWLKTRAGQESQTGDDSPMMNRVNDIRSWLKDKSNRARSWRPQADRQPPELLSTRNADTAREGSSPREPAGEMTQPTSEARTSPQSENELDRALNTLQGVA